MRITITRHRPGYPKRLAVCGDAQAPLLVSAPLGDPEHVVAIVGSRSAGPRERAFARTLARELARAGVTIVSGGARGVDTEAHEGALEGGGTTWLVSPSPPDREEADRVTLFARIEATPPSAMIWPFTDASSLFRHRARARNRVLVALADAVVVVQAGPFSGSRNTMTWTIRMRKPLWAVPAAPWMTAHLGSLLYLRDGHAKPLWDPLELFHALGVPAPDRKSLASAAAELPPARKAPALKVPQEPLFRLPAEPLRTEETVVISVLSGTPAHVDSIIDASGLTISAVRSALLTLTMKNVVVEGPDGFFRRQKEG